METRPITILALAGLAVALAACGSSGGWTPPYPVRIDSEGAVGDLFPSWVTWMSDAAKGHANGLLLRDGDVLVVADEDLPIRYDATDGRALTLTVDEARARIGMTVVSVSLAAAEGRDWVRRASVQELRSLRMIGLNGDLDAPMMAALKRVAAVNPHVDLSVDDEALTAALPLLEPRSVYAGDTSSPSALQALAGAAQLETLMIKPTEAGSLDVLPKLPRLSRLFLSEWDVAKAGPIPAGLSKLRALMIVDGKGMTDLSALSAVTDELVELSVNVDDGLVDLAGLDRLTRLHTLVLSAKGLTDLSALNQLTSLRWVALPPNTPPEQFVSFVKAHPDLVVLELMGCKAITDLSPLRDLRRLEGLVLDGAARNLDVVRGLSSLKFVGIARETWDASPDQIAAVQKALPDALVVRVSPLCLGSGWILSLIPVLLIMLWRRRVGPTRANA